MRPGSFGGGERGPVQRASKQDLACKSPRRGLQHDRPARQVAGESFRRQRIFLKILKSLEILEIPPPDERPDMSPNPLDPSPDRLRRQCDASTTFCAVTLGVKFPVSRRGHAPLASPSPQPPDALHAGEVSRPRRYPPRWLKQGKTRKKSSVTPREAPPPAAERVGILCREGPCDLSQSEPRLRENSVSTPNRSTSVDIARRVDPLPNLRSAHPPPDRRQTDAGRTPDPMHEPVTVPSDARRG